MYTKDCEILTWFWKELGTNSKVKSEKNQISFQKWDNTEELLYHCIYWMWNNINKNKTTLPWKEMTSDLSKA